VYWTGGPKLSHSPGFAGLAEVKRRVRQRLHKKLGSLLTCEEFGRAMESWQMGLGIQLGESLPVGRPTGDSFCCPLASGAKMSLDLPQNETMNLLRKIISPIQNLESQKKVPKL